MEDKKTTRVKTYAWWEEDDKCYKMDLTELFVSKSFSLSFCAPKSMLRSEEKRTVIKKMFVDAFVEAVTRQARNTSFDWAEFDKYCDDLKKD